MHTAMAEFDESPPSPPKRPLLETVAIICTKLAQGESEEDIHSFLDPENICAVDFIPSYIEFAIEKNWLIKDGDKYFITRDGARFIPTFLPKNIDAP
jgi:hypothetical protein